MREIVLRPEAEGDVEDISDYAIDQWGHEQARRYVEDLRAAIERLAISALRHPLYDAVWPGLRRKRSAMHHIYYLVADDRVEIVRIIHVLRDPGRHLKVDEWRE